ncbi:hypothetical protein HYDPIDRAFT_62856, partial [Hydnomerulius pinastri MD-312]
IRVDGRYRVQEALGSGSYATMYHAINIINRKTYAIKLEPRSDGTSSVEQEDCILKQLKGLVGLLCVHWFGQESSFDALVLDFLGPSLQELPTQQKKFSPPTVHHLGDQLLSRLQYIYSQGYIHGNIKPQNILMGVSDQSLTMFIVDFGTAKWYRDSDTRGHIPFCHTSHLTGMPAFTSINSHLGAEFGQCDDLECMRVQILY